MKIEVFKAVLNEFTAQLDVETISREWQKAQRLAQLGDFIGFSTQGLEFTSFGDYYDTIPWSFVETCDPQEVKRKEEEERQIKKMHEQLLVNQICKLETLKAKYAHKIQSLMGNFARIKEQQKLNPHLSDWEAQLRTNGGRVERLKAEQMDVGKLLAAAQKLPFSNKADYNQLVQGIETSTKGLLAIAADNKILQGD